MKKVMNATVFFLFTYPAGIVMGVALWFFRFFGILKAKGLENFPKQKGKILLVSNHPWKGEQFLLIGLFFSQYFLQPFRYGPWSMADRKNYYNKPRYVLMRSRLIPVDRTLKNGDLGSLAVAKSVLESGGNLIIFPEGGRTVKKGKEHELIRSKTGKPLRRLKAGFAHLATEVTGVTLLPVWFEFDSWRSMRLTIGKPVHFYGMQRKGVVQRTEKILLELADQTN